MGNNKKDISDILKDKFSGFEKQPSDELWDKISNKLNKKRKTAFYFRKPIAIAGLLLLLFGVFFISYFYIVNSQQSKDKRPQSTVNSSLTTINRPQSTVNNSQTNDNKLQTTVNRPQTTVNRPQTTINRPQTTVNRPQITVHRPQLSDKNQQTTDSIQNSTSIVQHISDSIPPKEENNTVLLNKDSINQELQVQTIKTALTDSALIKAAPETDTLKNKINKKIKSEILIGFNYSPEYFISNSELLSKNEDISRSSDLSFTLVFNKIIFRTGLGISFFNRDNWNYSFNYLKYEQIGNYLDIDSTTYAIIYDPLTQDTITKTVNFINEKAVYDYNNYIYKSEYIKNYAYIDIPLVIGYRFKEMKRWSINLNTGIIFSILIDSKITKIKNPANSSHIYNVETEETKRLSSNLKYLINLNISYKLNKLVELNFEPTWKSLPGNLYQGNTNRNNKPYSIGFRTGINIKIK